MEQYEIPSLVFNFTETEKVCFKNNWSPTVCQEENPKFKDYLSFIYGSQLERKKTSKGFLKQSKLHSAGRENRRVSAVFTTHWMALGAPIHDSCARMIILCNSCTLLKRFQGGPPIFAHVWTRLPSSENFFGSISDPWDQHHIET